MTESDLEIVAQEDGFWRAMQEKDVEATVQLSDEVCLLAGPQGISRVDRATMRKMFESEATTLRSFQFIGEPLVERRGDDVAMIAYRAQMECIVDGKPLALEADEVSTWIRRDGKWRCALHAESLPGDAFGRDRISATRIGAAIPSGEAHATIPVKDLARAQRFYEKTLGLTPLEEHGEGGHLIIYKSGAGSTVEVYESAYAGTNQGTALSWNVSSVDGVVSDLKAKGVSFEHYGDLPGMKLEGDVYAADGMKTAWFKDPDGNILNVLSRA